MQGKEASEQQANGKSSAGVDVSKDWLDAHVWPLTSDCEYPMRRRAFAS